MCMWVVVQFRVGPTDPCWRRFVGLRKFAPVGPGTVLTGVVGLIYVVEVQSYDGKWGLKNFDFDLSPQRLPVRQI